ncbi:MAG: helix-turn-helix transcriptional regulator [Elusimicrobia bacterium]|nr:helix-turn-helix transcriptional regulator [Elusimicrobiota bacterium]
MKTKKLYFDDWLKEQMKSAEFSKAYKEEDIRARLAVKIAETRQKKGLSQGNLARKLHTTQQAISDIETFKHSNLTISTLQKIAQALNSQLVIDFR